MFDIRRKTLSQPPQFYAITQTETLTGPLRQERRQNMRACMVAYSFYESDNRVRRYAETLARRGDQVDVISLQRDGQPSFEVLAGVHVYRIQKRVRNEKGPINHLARLVKFFLRSAWTLAVHHHRARYDLVHVHSVPDFQVFATLVPKLLGARVILDIHDIVPEFYASKFGVDERSLVFRMLRFIEEASAAYSDHVIISNGLWYEKLTRRSVPPEKCRTIMNYPDPSIFYRRPREVADNADFVMCYPGTLNWHQGIDVAIRAMVLLRAKAPHLKFLIIGDGPDREKLKGLIRHYHLEDRVTIAGLVSIDEIARNMANIDLGVVPKRRNSFGNEAFSTKILEFMAMGVPVVTSNTRIDQYYFREGLVRFFESENTEDLAANILDLAQNPAKLSMLRAQGDEFIQQNNWDVKKHEYLDLVDELVHRGQPALQVDRAAARVGL